MSEENKTPEIIDVEAQVVQDVQETPVAKPVGAPEALVSMTAIKPGDVGQMIVKLGAGDRLVDVDVEGDVEISRIMVGQQTIFRKGAQSWADALLGAGEGAFAIVLVQNKGDEPRIVEGTAFVARGAAGARIGSSSSGGVAPQAPSIGTRRDTSLAESVTVGQAHARPASTTVTPKRIVDARSVPMARVRRMVPASAPEPAHAPGLQGFGGEGVRVEGQSATMRHEAGDVVGALPRGGEHVVLMAPGHAHGLIDHLSHRRPMLSVFKTTLTRQMLAALDRVGVAGVSASSAEVDVCLPRGVLIHLAGYLRGTMGPLLPNEVAVVKAAIMDAFDRQNGRRRTPTQEDSKAITVAAIAATG